jgi:hypothetical protein
MNKNIFMAGHLCLSYIHLRLEDCRTFFCVCNVKGRVWVSFRGLVRALQLNKRVPGSSCLYFTVKIAVTEVVFLKKIFLSFFQLCLIFASVALSAAHPLNKR